MSSPATATAAAGVTRDIAVRAVRQACFVTSAVQATLGKGDTITKDDKSPVTIADYAAQALVSMTLADSEGSRFRLVGEEDADALRTDPALSAAVLALVQRVAPAADAARVADAIDKGSDPGGAGRFWALDPIDGTKGFLRQQQYAVALGLVEGGRPVLGVLGCPNLPVVGSHVDQGTKTHKGCILVAEHGRGAYIAALPRSLDESLSWTRVNPPAPAKAQHLRFCEGVEPGHSAHDVHAAIASELGIATEPVRVDSQCKYAIVAKGDASLYLRLTKTGYKEKIWDHAAGDIIVTESGATASDVDERTLNYAAGRTLLVNTPGIIVSRGAFHSQIAKVVRVNAEMRRADLDKLGESSAAAAAATKKDK